MHLGYKLPSVRSGRKHLAKCRYHENSPFSYSHLAEHRPSPVPLGMTLGGPGRELMGVLVIKE